MRRLLRSIFTSSPSDDVNQLNSNFNSISKTDLEFPHSEHQRAYEYIKAFFLSHKHVPDVSTLTEHFRRETKGSDVVDQIELLKTEKLIVRGDFVSWMNQKVEDRKILKTNEMLKIANEIATVGYEYIKEGDRGKPKTLKGPQDAIRYLMEQAHSILTPIGSVKISGEVHSDVPDYLKEYQSRKQDDMLGIGQFTGLEQMDVLLRGAKKKELWTHAAFTGHLKSTFSLNWAYTQAVYYKQDVCYFSLEMPYEQCRRNYYALHTIHEKFSQKRMELGLQEVPNLPTSLSYGRIRDSELSEEEEEFFLKYVLPDICDPKQNYGKVHFEVSDPDKPEITVAELKARAETIHAQNPFSMIIVDHALLIGSNKNYSSRTDQANEVMRDLKKLALNFDRGSGIAVLALFQMNRTGYKSALLKGGLYDLTALSYSNEVERSSDIITATWCEGVMKEEGYVLFQNLKTRDLEPFRPFLARIEWPCKRLITCYENHAEYMDEERKERRVREVEEATVGDLTLL